MILKALTLENFKGIREPVRIEFAPLTLLFGPNNAGKSTVVQALMYAREVLERHNCDAGQTVLGGDVVDLGGFDNLVHGHNRDRAIRMRFDLHLPQGLGGAQSDWVRDAKLDSNVSDFYSNAPKKLDIVSAARFGGQLVDVWVEFEIAWSERHKQPLVRTYAVGTDSNEYARISFDTEKDKAALTHVNFGAYPFGTRYEKGDLTEFEWQLAKEARNVVRRTIAKHDVNGLKLKKGARVAMVGENVPESANRLPHEKFDEIVTAIVRGEDDWGDETIDENTGEHNSKYAQRQSLIEVVQSQNEPAKAPALDLDILESLSNVSSDPKKDSPDASEDQARTDPLSKMCSDADDANADDAAKGQNSDDANEYVCEEWEARMERLAHGEDYEIDSWMLMLFAALMYEDTIPVTPNWALPLPLKGSALPEWGRNLDLDYDVWLPEESREFWEYPAFAQEVFKDLLTVAIVNPGNHLLKALQKAIYISPFRTMPPRHYQPARSPDPGRWADGLAAWDWLLLKDKSFAVRVNEWLSDEQRFNTGFEIDLRHYLELEVDSELLTRLAEDDASMTLDLDWLKEQLAGLPEGRRLQIRDCRTGVQLFPKDMGVGLSQVLPVIVAAMHKEDGIVAIEEPESNIHPAFQVVLADLFINEAKRNKNLMFLVETHSEHLMLRCLRRIRETSEGESASGLPPVRPDDVAVHFVEPSERGPAVHRIRIDEEGGFMDHWPRGFFPERMKEVYGDDL
jgi:ABC-type ATPase involved in cell division